LGEDESVSQLSSLCSALLLFSKWQVARHGVMVVEVDPRGTSTTCPKCGGEMTEVGHRRMKCTACGFETGRDVVALLNIEKRACERLGTPTFSHRRL